MNKKISFFCLQLLVFSLPLVPRLIPILIIAFCFFRLLENGIKIPRSSTNRLSIVYWLLGLVSLLYTSESTHGRDDIIRMLPLVLFPLFLSSSSIDTDQVKNIVRSFVAGNVLALCLSLINSTYIFYLTNDTSEFYYTNFSQVLHPSYFSMYLMTGIIALFLIPQEKEIRPWLKSLMLAFFSLGIVLCSSRIGIIILLVFYLGLIISVFKNNSSGAYKSLAVLTILLGVGFLFMSKGLDRFQSLFTQPKEISTNDNSLARKSIWKASLTASAAYFPFGTGLGGENAAVSEKLKEMGHTDLAKRNLNSHNQFLDALLGLGLPGFLCLLALFVYSIMLSIRQSNLFFLGFLFICLLNFLFESMLGRQEGVVFVSFFIVFSSFLKEQNISRN